MTSSHSERDEREVKCLQKFVSFEHRLFAKVCELRVFAKVCNLERMRGLQSIKPGSYPVGVEEESVIAFTHSQTTCICNEAAG